MAADALGFLDALELDRVDLIGHSMGGLVGYLLAGDHPERVGRLILEDVAALRPRERGSPGAAGGGAARSTGRWCWPSGARSTSPTRPGWDRLGRITAPTLVIGGGAGSHVPQDWVADLARRIPGARLETIEAGHLIHDTEPDAFTRTALAFLGRPRRRARWMGPGYRAQRRTLPRAWTAVLMPQRRARGRHGGRPTALRRAAGTPDRAAQEQRYLKSELEFFGVTVPELRRVVKAAVRGYPGLDAAGDGGAGRSRCGARRCTSGGWRRPRS